MHTIRRVVTGHRGDGKSIIASDQDVSAVEFPPRPGSTLTVLWGADETLTYPDSGTEPSHHTFFPPIGGFRCVELVLAPDGTSPPDVDPRIIAAEVDRRFPGLMAIMTMLPEDPGMHRSATVDVLYVLSGRCVLELDDGSATELSAGDVVVQSGTMHRWHNRWGEPCRIIGLMVGARLK